MVKANGKHLRSGHKRMRRFMIHILWFKGDTIVLRIVDNLVRLIINDECMVLHPLTKTLTQMSNKLSSNPLDSSPKLVWFYPKFENISFTPKILKISINCLGKNKGRSSKTSSNDNKTFTTHNIRWWFGTPSSIWDWR